MKVHVAAEIARLGEDKVLGHEDFVIFYSGPSGEVLTIIVNKGKSNHGRSLDMVIELGWPCCSSSSRARPRETEIWIALTPSFTPQRGKFESV